MTNVEKVTHMMEHSNYGALKQVFIMEAIRNYSEQTVKSDFSKWNNGFISKDAWKSIAEETLKECNTEMTVLVNEEQDEE